ncbi:MAG: CDP-glycerol glycerophosphotransferase family protein [Lachnospiraceae bacterium]|nr:CDP-glycerol glycerophosphotransferase family protein [Lachnospiraceae bacterium]
MSIFGNTVNVSEEKNIDIDFSEREQKLEAAKKLVTEKGAVSRGESINDFYFNLPLKDKTVLMIGLGKNVRGNLKYLLDVMNTSDKFEGFEIFVRTSPESDQQVKDFIRQYGWKRTESVPDDSTYDRLMESAKYLFTEVFFAGGWIKKEGQVVINIWHGTPLKKLGLAKQFRTAHKNGNTQKNFIDADYLVYPNEYTKTNLSVSYGIPRLAKGKAVMLGYPRTGGMLKELENPDAELEKQLSPNGERIYAYMPTFRDYLETDVVIDKTKRLLDRLDEGLKDDQILYVNLHHKVSGNIDYSGYKHIKQFPGDVDSYRLLAHTDALITDYSSVFFDYLAGGKQIVLYHRDYEKYRKRRGTYMDLLSLPFDKAVDAAGILSALERGKTYDDEDVKKEFCPFDSVENAEKLSNLFLLDETGLKAEAFDTTSVKKKLIFSQDLEKCSETSVLGRALDKADKNGREFYIGCSQEQTDLNKDSAYPLLFRNIAFGGSDDMHISSVGKSLNELAAAGSIGFDQWIDMLKYDYAAHARRLYAGASFDEILIYDVKDPAYLFTLATLKGPKLLFINKKTCESMKTVPLFKETVKYVLPYMSAVVATGKKEKEMFSESIGQGCNVQLCKGVSDLRRLLER